MRYGTNADRKYISNDFLQTYDTLVVNANMLAHTPSAIATFIAQEAANKPFIVDPQTQAFQHDIALLKSTNDEGATKLKTSIDKLLKIYGEPLLSRVTDEQSVLPTDFVDPGVLREFVRRVGEFQRNTVFDRAEDKGLTKYYEFLEIRAATPIAIVAPYFYMDARTLPDWLPINIKMAQTSKMEFQADQVYAELVIGKDVLDNHQLLEEISEKYGELSIDGVLMWIDDFSEHAASQERLENYSFLMRTLGTRVPVVAMYGSYFSISLMRYIERSGLAGVCHGLEYGEHRAVVPALGGIPMSKFYYPELHRRYRYVDALRLARPNLGSSQSYLHNVCSCATCKEVIGGSQTADIAFGLFGKSHPVTFRRRHQIVTLEYPDTDTHDKCVRHYMWNKQKEYQEHDRSLGEVIQGLRGAYDRHARSVGLSGVVHCKIWADTLESVSRGHE